jgi:hypothetical protein
MHTFFGIVGDTACSGGLAKGQLPIVSLRQVKCGRKLRKLTPLF